MKYIESLSLGKNKLHRFISEGTHYIEKKKWKNVSLNILEGKLHKQGTTEPKYMLTIRYDNSAKDYQLCQFGMGAEELTKLRDVLNSILN